MVEPDPEFAELLTALAAETSAVERAPSPLPHSGGPHYPLASTTAAEVAGYTENVLKISVPVTVTLAAQNLPIQQLLRLAPGSILRFDKSCDALLDLEVNGRVVAKGIVVTANGKLALHVVRLMANKPG